ALSGIGVQRIAVTEAKGFGRQKGHAELYRVAEYVAHFLPKVKLEAALRDDLLERTSEAIEKAANAGKSGDGNIFVFARVQVVRGVVRSKNVLSVLMQVFVIFSLIVVLWSIYGYSIAFTENNAFFGGFDRLFLSGIFTTKDGVGSFATAATFSKATPIPEYLY